MWILQCATQGRVPMFRSLSFSQLIFLTSKMKACFIYLHKIKIVKITLLENIINFVPLIVNLFEYIMINLCFVTVLDNSLIILVTKHIWQIKIVSAKKWEGIIQSDCLQSSSSTDSCKTAHTLLINAAHEECL